MNIHCLTLTGAALLTSAAFGQNQASMADVVPVDTTAISYRGVYDAASQQFSTAATRGTLGDAIYNNTANSGFFYNCIDGRKVIDEGLIPRPSTVGFPGTFDSYDLSSFQLNYVTDATDPSLGGTGNSVEIAIYESYAACSSAAGSEAPVAVINLSGLPGSTDGMLAAFSVDVDISGLDLCLRAEGRDGLANSASQRFGWSFRVTDNADATAGVGVLIAGDPDNVPSGDGTTWQNPGNPGSGLGTADLFRREGSSDPMVPDGCLFFGGYPAQIFGSFNFVLRSGLSGDCIGCGLGDDNFEENDHRGVATPLSLGAVNSLIQDDDDDWYTFMLPAGDTLRVDAIFSTSIADLDLYLFDAMGMGLDTGFTGSDNEDVQYTNCGTSDQQVWILVDNFDGVCNEYDLILSSPVGLAADALEDNDDCLNPVPLPIGLTRGLTITTDICSGVDDFDYYSYQLADGDTISVDILFEDAIADLDLFAYDTSIGCDGGTTDPETLDFGFSSTDNETVRVTNTSGSPIDIVVRVDRFGTGENTYDMVVNVQPVETYGSVICAGSDNSTGDSARLYSTGSDVAMDNALMLNVAGAPPGEFGIFFASQDNIQVTPVGSQGTICIAGLSIARFNDSIAVLSAMGTASYSPNLTSIPFEAGGMSIPTAMLAGDSLNFQHWHRDMVGPTAVSNLSDAITITFQ